MSSIYSTTFPLTDHGQETNTNRGILYWSANDNKELNLPMLWDSTVYYLAYRMKRTLQTVTKLNEK